MLLEEENDRNVVVCHSSASETPVGGGGLLQATLDDANKTFTYKLCTCALTDRTLKFYAVYLSSPQTGCARVRTTRHKK